MPEIVNCPQCERKLRVPDNLLGQLVKCPTCSTTFTASAAPAEAAPLVPESAAPAPAPPPPPPAAPYPKYDMPAPQAGAPYPRYDLPPPYPGASSQQPRYADQGPPLDFDDPRERRRQLRPAAMSAVAGPAIALLVVGIIGIVGSSIGVCAGIFVSAAGPQARRGGGVNDGFESLLGVLFYGVMLVTSIVVVACSTKMKRLDSYAAAMTASILAVIPCLSPCFVLGIPFGIWALIVINQGDVKEAFYS
jgi:predicted Zn finger-like uncharacterized protein